MNIVPAADAQGQLEEEEAAALAARGFVVLQEFQGERQLAQMVADEIPGGMRAGALVAVGPTAEGHGSAVTPPATPLQGASTVAAAAVTRTVLEGDTYPALKRALTSIRAIPADLNACKATAGWAMVAPLGGTTTVLFTPCTAAAVAAAPTASASGAALSSASCCAEAGECARVYGGADGERAGSFLRDTLDVQEAVQGQLPPAGGQQAAVLCSAQERAKLGAVLAIYWPWGGEGEEGGVLLHPVTGGTAVEAVFVPAAQDSLLLVRSAAWAVQLLPAVSSGAPADAPSKAVIFSVFHPSLLFGK